MARRQGESVGQNSLMLHVKGGRTIGILRLALCPLRQAQGPSCHAQDGRTSGFVDIILLLRYSCRLLPDWKDFIHGRRAIPRPKRELLFIPLKNFFCEAEESAPAGLEVRGIVSPL